MCEVPDLSLKASDCIGKFAPIQYKEAELGTGTSSACVQYFH